MQYIIQECLFLVFRPHLTDHKIIRQILHGNIYILPIVYMMVGVQVVFFHHDGFQQFSTFRHGNFAGGILHVQLFVYFVALMHGFVHHYRFAGADIQQTP